MSEPERQRGFAAKPRWRSGSDFSIEFTNFGFRTLNNRARSCSVSPKRKQDISSLLRPYAILRCESATCWHSMSSARPPLHHMFPVPGCPISFILNIFCGGRRKEPRTIQAPERRRARATNFVHQVHFRSVCENAKRMCDWVRGGGGATNFVAHGRVAREGPKRSTITTLLTSRKCKRRIFPVAYASGS